MKQIKFRLKKGMKDNVLLVELRGKTSGETQQEIQQFMTKSEDLSPTHEVLLVEDQYAIILKRELKHRIIQPTQTPQPTQTIDTSYEQILKPHAPIQTKEIIVEETKEQEPTHEEKLTNRYFLAGINDEGYYFIHRLDGFEEQFLVTNRFPTMKQVLAWVNREDQGYFGRIQGDMVYKYMHVNERHQRTSNEFCKVVLGRHMITSDQIAFDNTTKTILVWHNDNNGTGARADAVISHPEHGVKTIEIPRNHQLVITGQRGRDIEFDESKGVAAGFD